MEGFSVTPGSPGWPILAKGISVKWDLVQQEAEENHWPADEDTRSWTQAFKGLSLILATRQLDHEVKDIFRNIKAGVAFPNASVRFIYRAAYYGFVHKYRIRCSPQECIELGKKGLDVARIDLSSFTSWLTTTSKARNAATS